ncbi:MAG: GlsB/YeaQ/YmgE family stress response membrane protein [Odoribacter sp.]
MAFILFVMIGMLAGYVAGKIMRGGGFGLVANIVIGMIGSILGGWLFSLVGLQSTGGFISSLLVATIGAIVLLWIVSLFQRNKV